jgi:Protein of unknown function (DUF3224)
MKISIVKGILGAAVVVAMLSGRAMPAQADKDDNVTIVVDAVPGPFTGGDPGTCDPTTFSPKPGDPMCVGEIGEVFTISGGMVGSLQFEESFAEFADGTFPILNDWEAWTGTINGRGTGSFTLQEYDIVSKLNGDYHSLLRIVPGSGSGDFEGITGAGTSKGNSNLGVNTLMLKFPHHR